MRPHSCTLLLSVFAVVSCAGTTDENDGGLRASAGGRAIGGGGGASSTGGGTHSTGGGTHSTGGGTHSTGGGTSSTGGGTSSTGGGTSSTGGGTSSTGGGTSSTGGGTSSAGGGTSSAGGGTSSAGGGGAALDKFSFFVTSWAAISELANAHNGSTVGFGGDLSYGETGAGAGLRGADKICATIAERSMKGSSSKVWRAFLSAKSDGSGSQVNAIDRVGPGPWYDRNGRLVAATKADLLYDRPKGAASAIANDLPNEDGVPNHNPDGTGKVDNHDTLTGSNTAGKLYSQTATCSDWTSTSTTIGKPRVGHSWPFQGSGVNWISALDEGGCGAGINLSDNPPGPTKPTVGSGGGYGGFYCFALSP